MTNESSYESTYFAHALRGIASLFVVYRHIFEAFWFSAAFNGDLIRDGAFIMHPSSIENIFLEFSYVMESKFHFNIATFGVSIFFLVSGFVIPISLENKGFIDFCINRFIRIVPTCIAGITLGIFAVAVYRYTLATNPLSFYNWNQYFANILILPRLLFNMPFIDPVTWTLEIELIFYSIMALLNIGQFTRRYAGLSIIALPLFMKIVALLFHFGDIGYTVFGSIIFMNIGVCLCKLYKKKWSITKTIAIILYLVLCCYLFLEFKIDQSYKFNLLDGFLFFLLFYWRRGNIKHNRFFDFFSKISYSLYVTHQLLGYVLMATLLFFTNNMYLSSVVAFSFTIIFAYNIYKLVERPTILLSKQSGRITALLHTDT